MQKRIVFLLVCWVSQSCSRPLTSQEELLSSEAFALQELVSCQYDALFFLPDDTRRAHKIILGLIDQEQKAIRAALFRITDNAITKALIAAHKRGVFVEVVIDPGALEKGHYSKVFQLLKAGVIVYQYQTTELLPLSKKPSGYQTIMHHKTFIFDRTVGNHTVAVFGSLNPTHAGFNGNEEVVAIRNAAAIVNEFKQQFEKIKNRSAYLVATDVPEKSKKKRVSQQKTGAVTTLARGMHTVARVCKRIVH